MFPTKLLYLPLIAGGLCMGVQAGECRPDASNTTFTVASKKFYCQESLDTSGCNAGRAAVRIVADSSCNTSAELDIVCSARFALETRKMPDGTERSVMTEETITLRDGHAEEKIYFSLNSLTDPMSKIDIVDVTCAAAGAPTVAAPQTAPVAAPVPVPAPQYAVPAAPAPQAAPAVVPQPVQPVAQPVAAPVAQPVQPAPADDLAEKRLDLEILKEQNRARELDLKALELKIKLKEMER